MIKKRIYLIEFSYHRLFTESREQAEELWHTLIDGNFKLLETKYGENEKFPYSKELNAELHSEVVDLCANKEESELAVRNSNKLKAYGIKKSITPKP